MYNVFRIMVLAMALIIFSGCPSGSQETQSGNGDKKSTTTKSTESEEPSIDTSEADALMSEDGAKWGSDSVKTVENYSLYREYFKQRLYDDAMPYWRYVYANAPAARKTPLLNGEKMYKSFLDKQITACICEKGEVEGKNKKECKTQKKGKFVDYKWADEKLKEAYLDSIEMVYDTRVEHFGEEGLVTTLKYRLMKKYNLPKKDSLLALQKKVVDIESEYTSYDVMYDYYKNLLLQYKAKTLTYEQFEPIYDNLMEAVDFNVNRNEDATEKMVERYTKYGDKMESVWEKILAVEEAKTELEAAKAATDCPSIKEYYGGKYAENPNDVRAIKTYYKKLKRGGCTSDPEFMRLLLAWNKIEPSASRLRYMAQVYQKQGDISNTESYYRQSLELENDPSKQAKVYLTLAKIAYASKKDFPEARRLAQKAAQLQAGWGAPYMLIGNLYASSASKVNDGVNGRTVYYAAVDMFRKAADIDPSVKSDADAKIGKWSGQYPTQDDKNGYFMSKGKAFPAVGSGITVGGWIGQRTTVK